MLNKKFARVLQQLRKRKGFSQETFGFEANLHRTYVSQLERGLKSPSLETLERICKALGIKMSRLLQLIEKQ
jgi:transcriptional regulator with XRE-family HTH domain